MTDQSLAADPFSGLMPEYRTLMERLDAQQQALLNAFQHERQFVDPTP
jgi:hypothetical protein